MKVTPLKRAIGIYKPGQPFELPDRQARHLIKAKLVREYIAEAAAQVAAPAPSPQTETLTVEIVKPKRVYKRRDMAAEGAGQ